MSQISLHTSRETTPSRDIRAMWPLELFVGIYGGFLVAFSIYLFMVNATSEKVSESTGIPAQTIRNMPAWKERPRLENRTATRRNLAVNRLRWWR